MTIPDPVAALRTAIAADAAVAALAGTRVYAGEMPASEVPNQPRGAVLIEAAGGPGDPGFVQLGRTSVDVRTYGPTPYHAMKLHLAVHEFLKNLERKVVTPGPVLLHHATPEGGPLELRDPDAKWPFVYRTYELLAAEVAA